MSVLIETTSGTLLFDLYTDSQPVLCRSFLNLCQSGYYFFAPFYGLLTDSSILCGIPNYPIVDDPLGRVEVVEAKLANLESIPTGLESSIGTLLITTESRELGTVYGSVFSIALGNDKPANSIAIGKLVEGFRVLEEINSAPIDSNKRFLQDIRITYIHTIHNPFGAITDTIQSSNGLVPSKEQIQHMRLANINASTKPDHVDPTSSEKNALTLELLGDLSHYKIKPSPTTLFVAKLNPITTSESLKIFFGRFGKVLLATIIQKNPATPNTTRANNRNSTGKKSAYAFIEYETQSEADSAYAQLSKGCVIDGNQVYVDFSQSTTK